MSPMQREATLPVIGDRSSNIAKFETLPTSFVAEKEARISLHILQKSNPDLQATRRPRTA
jgi:hypothetical protein